MDISITFTVCNKQGQYVKTFDDSIKAFTLPLLVKHSYYDSQDGTSFEIVKTSFNSEGRIDCEVVDHAVGQLPSR